MIRLLSGGRVHQLGASLSLSHLSSCSKNINEAIAFKSPLFFEIFLKNIKQEYILGDTIFLIVSVQTFSVTSNLTGPGLGSKLS